jgi:hypothetical protein
MALHEIERGSPPAGDTLTDALIELQGLRISVVNGADDDVNIPVTGIGADDTLVSVLEVAPVPVTYDAGPPVAVGGGGVTLADRTAEAEITSAGNIQLATHDTTGHQLIVVWFDKQDEAA